MNQFLFYLIDCHSDFGGGESSFPHRPLQVQE